MLLVLRTPTRCNSAYQTVRLHRLLRMALPPAVLFLCYLFTSRPFFRLLSLLPFFACLFFSPRIHLRRATGGGGDVSAPFRCWPTASRIQRSSSFGYLITTATLPPISSSARLIRGGPYLFYWFLLLDELFLWGNVLKELPGPPSFFLSTRLSFRSTYLNLSI